VDFVAVVDQAIALLRQRGRLTYRTLQLQFQLDAEHLAVLTDELIKGQRLAADEDGTVLVWIGDAAIPPAPAVAPAPTAAPLTYTPPYLAEKILTSKSAMEGERKQVTVLFADLTGNTELIRDLDPEAGQTLLDTALRHMMDAVHRFEGTVNDVAGDGLMAMFGAPIAHEDHALRACYAALAMQGALRRYAEDVRRTQGLEVLLRVGLNSGGVLVRTIGNDLYMNYSGVGLTTNLAHRMEQLAPPGTIRLTAATLQLAEGAVRVNALGPIPVKGLAEPIEVFELVGATPVHRRLQAAVARGLTRFVGRDQELTALMQALAQAAQGQGQLVALLGEAGVGKSRLVYEFVHGHATQGLWVLESASVSYGRATPYFPVIDLLKRYAHVEDTDDARTIRVKVTGQVLTLDETLQDTLPALLALLDVLPDDSPFHQLDPAQRRQRTLTALKRLLLRESQVQPLLLVFEDLHWIDTETQALLDSLVESLPTAQLLLLVNYRPEYQHGWGSKTYYTQLRLDPLAPGRADAFLHALLGDDPHLAPLTQLLIERTGGNPFFLEESVRTLVETGVLVGAPGAYRLVQALPTIQVPATVHAVLAARIDRLPPEEKHLLQTAAVIGTEVSLPLLQAIAELPEEALHRGLVHLQAAEFLYETRLFPQQAYTFKHALTHEVAYGSLLQERRRGVHAHIVEALEALAGDRGTEVAPGRSPDQVSTVGMPVTRHPPYSPGRAVFPHPVLRLYSLPRCKAKPSGKHPPTWNLRDTRTHYLDAVEHVSKLLPRVTPLLASPPVEPFERTVHRPMEKAVERAGVPAHAIVVVVAAQSRVQTLEEFPPRQVPVLLNPFREPLAGGVELLPCGASHDAGHAVPIWHPEELKSQKGEAPLLARVKTAEPAQMGLLRRHLEVEFPQPLGQHPKKPFCVLLQAEGTHPVIRIAAQQCLTLTVWFHHLLKPQVQGIVQIHIGEDGRDRAALRRPSLGMDDLAIRVQNTCLQPFVNQAEKGPVVDTPAQHVHQPRMVHVVKEALDISLYQVAIPSVLEVEGEVADRIQRPPSGAIAVTALQKILLIDGR
jgi:class 3 adenylate cyclase